MTKALNDGELDVAVLLTEGIVKDIACGGKNKIVGVFVSSPLCWGIHTGAGNLSKRTFLVGGLAFLCDPLSLLPERGL